MQSCSPLFSNTASWSTQSQADAWRLSSLSLFPSSLFVSLSVYPSAQAVEAFLLNGKEYLFMKYGPKLGEANTGCLWHFSSSMRFWVCWSIQQFTCMLAQVRAQVSACSYVYTPVCVCVSVCVQASVLKFYWLCVEKKYAHPTFNLSFYCLACQPSMAQQPLLYLF